MCLAQLISCGRQFPIYTGIIEAYIYMIAKINVNIKLMLIIFL